jgi:hypothetical protein
MDYKSISKMNVFVIRAQKYYVNQAQKSYELYKNLQKSNKYGKKVQVVVPRHPIGTPLYFYNCTHAQIRLVMRDTTWDRHTHDCSAPAWNGASCIFY